MPLVQLTLRVDERHALQVEELLALGGLAFEVQDGATLARPPPGQVWFNFFPPDDGAVELATVVRRLLAQGGLEADLHTAAGPGENWRDAWKAFFKPVVVGPFVVVPSWERHESPPAQTVIDLDPGRAFGTGGHASTRLCLAALGRLADCRRFLDVGCGSGVLAIACARRWPAATGVAIDHDPEAVAVTEENAAKNGVAGRIRSGLALDSVEGLFDVVLANITAETIAALAGLLAARTAPGGRLILSGILAEQASAVAAALEVRGLRVERVDDEDEWRGITLRRPA